MVNEVNLSPKFLSNQVKYVQHPPHHQAPPSEWRGGIQGGRSYRDSLMCTQLKGVYTVTRYLCTVTRYLCTVTLSNTELIPLHYI